MKPYLAIIPARGGSKSIPLKNIADLKGKPLMSWTIEEVLKVISADCTFVSTDNDEIEEVARKAGVKTIRRREGCSGDDASSESVVLDAFRFLENQHKCMISELYQSIILLQPTSPFRSSSCLARALHQYENDYNSKSMISVKKINSKCFKYLMDNKDGYLKGIHNDALPFIPRQNLPTAYAPNGAIFISDIKQFEKTHSFLNQPCQKFIMCDNASIDIDSNEDLAIANKLTHVSDCLVNKCE